MVSIRPIYWKILRGIAQLQRRRDVQTRLSCISIDSISEVRLRALCYVERLRLKDKPYGRYRYRLGDDPPLGI